MRQAFVLRLVLIGAVFLLCGSKAYAQTEITDFMGRPVMVKQYLDVKGSPYLDDAWQEGWVKMQDGKAYLGVRLKYDQVADELMFANGRGEAQFFVQPVKEFELKKRLFRSGYAPADDTPPSAFYEVLADGPTQLLKWTFKWVHEEVPYGSATKVKSILEQQNYYLADRNGKLTKLKKDRRSLLQALGGKQAELEQYTRTNRLDLRKEQDMTKLVMYYNSL
ncbi:hypothetical protein [Pontibacter indicus]|uniref:WG containing repeat-containing protein n=1 Tax=Pontibacter indicus TaxID=1317125 RepID=A0A1R3XAP9_9BACT|nr:hypothetical protein [Pontibacter indicus]SIT88063.1 hypothetical protein SAMN05444128_1768 [Pontibacter indicus]